VRKSKNPPTSNQKTHLRYGTSILGNELQEFSLAACDLPEKLPDGVR